jgi:hypothetical protein
MQKKFSKKLKGVNSCEKNSLTRLKANFAEAMVKKDVGDVLLRKYSRS